MRKPDSLVRWRGAAVRNYPDRDAFAWLTAADAAARDELIQTLARVAGAPEGIARTAWLKALLVHGVEPTPATLRVLRNGVPGARGTQEIAPFLLTLAECPETNGGGYEPEEDGYKVRLFTRLQQLGLDLDAQLCGAGLSALGLAVYRDHPRTALAMVLAGADPAVVVAGDGVSGLALAQRALASPMPGGASVSDWQPLVTAMSARCALAAVAATLQEGGVAP